MVQHMHSKFKMDSKVRFQLMLEDVTGEEYYLQQLINPGSSPYINEMNLESFFTYKSDKYIDEDRHLSETIFVRDIRFFSMREHNDTITLSSELLEKEDNFNSYINTFSCGKAFKNYCTYLIM